MLKEILYWYASDYCDVFVADRIHEQVDATQSFAADLILGSDLADLRYLYRFGEYISDGELTTAKYLLSLDETTIQKMADVYTEGNAAENGGRLHRGVPDRICQYRKRSV